MEIKTVSKNRKALFEYFIIETIEAGISLKGSEIKSIRAGQVSLQEAYIQIEKSEAWLINSHIAVYDAASYTNHEPKRPRRLLLHKKEIRELSLTVKQKGVTIIPLKMYLKDGRAKIEIAVAKGKKLYDKRQDLSEKDSKRDIERAMSKRE
jgi:SsrA-binding protein